MWLDILYLDCCFSLFAWEFIFLTLAKLLVSFEFLDLSLSIIIITTTTTIIISLAVVLLLMLILLMTYF